MSDDCNSLEVDARSIPRGHWCWAVWGSGDWATTVRDLAQGQYQTELTLTEGCLSPVLVQDVIIEVRRLYCEIGTLYPST